MLTRVVLPSARCFLNPAALTWNLAQVFSQIARSCALSGTVLPPRFKAIVDKFGDNPKAMQQAGIAYATDQIIDLFANGVTNVHVYSMNKPDVAQKIQSNLSDILGK